MVESKDFLYLVTKIIPIIFTQRHEWKTEWIFALLDDWVSCHVNMSKIFPYYYAHKVDGFVWKITLLLTLKYISDRAIQYVILAKINSIGEVSRLLWKVLEHRFFRVPAEYQFSYHNDTTFYYFTAIRKTYLTQTPHFFSSAIWIIVILLKTLFANIIYHQ